MADSKKGELAKVENGGAIALKEGYLFDNFSVFRADEQELCDLIDLNLRGQKVSEFDLSRIRIPAGGTKHWTVPTLDGEDVAEVIEGIIVFYKDIRAWWPDVEPSGQPPQCRSNDSVLGLGLRWDGDKENEQHECQTCPHKEFGSAPKGAGQWCKQMRAVYLLRGETYLPTVIFLPPTSIKGSQQYFMKLVDFGMPIHGVVTKFSLVVDKNTMGQSYNRVTLSVGHQFAKEERIAVSRYVKKIREPLESRPLEVRSDDYYSPPVE